LFASCGRVENDGCIIHAKKWERALTFPSNWDCVASPRAKVALGCVDCLWNRDGTRRDCRN
jgi:hypothetical protein